MGFKSPHPFLNGEKMDIIKQAREFAIERHGDQKYKDHPYIYHLDGVRSLVEEFDGGFLAQAVALLHDVLEDTDTTYEDLIHEFNREIADIVVEVTQEGEKEPGFYFPNLRSRRAFLVMFADRLSNLSRMKDWPGDWQLEYLNNSVFWKQKPWKKEEKASKKKD